MNRTWDKQNNPNWKNGIWCLNPKKYQREYNTRWRIENADRIKKSRKIYYKLHKNQRKRYSHRYYLAHIDRIKRYSANYYKSLSSDTKHKYRSEYYKKHRDERRRTQKIVRAKRHGALGTHSSKEWSELKKKYHFTCLMCNKKEPEIKLTEDHIIPLSKGGTDYINNIQPLCRRCNCKKGRKIQNP